MLFGGEGDDVLWSGPGNDYLVGGDGSNKFWLEFDPSSESSELKTLEDFFRSKENQLRVNTVDKYLQRVYSEYIFSGLFMEKCQPLDSQETLYVSEEDLHFYFWVKKPNTEDSFENSNYCYKQKLCSDGILEWAYNEWEGC
jgi:Ca2+-binding RTX toxin-like protein